jgi:hypothetical protein
MFGKAHHLPYSPTMSLIYSDSFQDDEDLCNILAALQLGSRPMTVVRDPGPQAVVTQAAMSTQHVRSEAPVPIAGPSGKCLRIHSYSCLILILLMTVVILGQTSSPDRVYVVSSGKRTGVKNSWYVL